MKSRNRVFYDNTLLEHRRFGKNTVWEHPLLAEKITLSGNDGDDAPNYHEKRVISDLQKLKDIEE